MRLAAISVAVTMLASAAAPAGAITDPDVALLRDGARIDEECLRRNVIDEIGKCRVAATAAEQAAPLMLGLWFHMWFSDVVLSRLYSTRNSEISAKFEQLADAEFPAVLAYQRQLGIEVSELCRVVAVDCKAAIGFRREWMQRPRPEPG